MEEVIIKLTDKEFSIVRRTKLFHENLTNTKITWARFILHLCLMKRND